MMFEGLLVAAGFLAGAIASVSGFGIGSILTPLLSLQTGTRLAVAATSIPHLTATLVRFLMLRHKVDRRVLIHFGILSAAGGLTGALLYSVAANPMLTAIFAFLLIFAGIMNISGYGARMHFGRKTAWIAGGLSGMLGGLVGNQGGIRSAALLGFRLDRQSFVATATAIGVVVDCVRLPVYLATAGRELMPIAGWIVIAAAGALAGTFFGKRVLQRIPEQLFGKIVGGLILALGIFMMWRIRSAGI